MLVVSGDEDHQRHGGLCGNGFEHFEASQSGELDIEENQVRHECFDLLDGFEPVPRFSHHFNNGMRGEEARQARARRLLVVNDDAPHTPCMALVRGRSTVAQLPPPSRGASTTLARSSYSVFSRSAMLDRKSTRLNSSHLGIS